MLFWLNGIGRAYLRPPAPFDAHGRAFSEKPRPPIAARPSEFPVRREIFANLAQKRGFSSKTAGHTNSLRQNSRCRHNREFPRPNRELNLPNRELIAPDGNCAEQ